MTTGTGDTMDGLMDVFADDGTGEKLIASGNHVLGSVVIDSCFDGFVSFSVQNQNVNAWAGSIELSTGSGQSWVPAQCATLCTSSPACPTASTGGCVPFLFDGDGCPDCAAASLCTNGDKCNIAELMDPDACQEETTCADATQN
eukprot:gene196-11052_t